MAFTDLPVELIRIIVSHAIPEAFEGLALSCKFIYEICVPFIVDYNNNTKIFRNFSYCCDHEIDLEKLGYSHMHSARELIINIAKTPVLARYIQTADFSGDSSRLLRCKCLCYYHEFTQVSKELVLELLANSHYLQQAGIDPEEFYCSIEIHFLESTLNPIEELWESQEYRAYTYSQDAAAFLLTLLPNLKELQLPWRWSSSRQSDKLLSTILARSKTTENLLATPSLKPVKKIIYQYSNNHQEHDDRIAFLERDSALLSLPNINEFHGKGYNIRGNLTIQLAPYLNIKSIILSSCYMDHQAIACLLWNTPNIVSLEYCHHPLQSEPDPPWSFSLFLRAIENSVGSRLENLSIQKFHRRRVFPSAHLGPRLKSLLMLSSYNHHASSETDLRPGSISMFSFLCLRKFRFQLELLSKSILIPPTILELSLFSRTHLYNHKVFEKVIKDLILGKKSGRLALRELNVFNYMFNFEISRPDDESWSPPMELGGLSSPLNQQLVKQLKELKSLGVDITLIELRPCCGFAQFP